MTNAALNILRDFTASIQGSNLTTSNVTSPNFMQIGTGSYTFNAGSDALQTAFSGTVIGTGGMVKSDKTVTMEGFWDSVSMSGGLIKEMAVRTGSTAAAGSMWIYNAFSGTQFDGSKELIVSVEVNFTT